MTFLGNKYINKWVVYAVAYSARKFKYGAMNIAQTDINVDKWLVALGLAIRLRRKELGLSQEALANVVHIDRSHMGRIERGERNLTFANIVKISVGLKCSPSALLLLAGL